mgnify:CR=1 FL=1
MTGSPERWRDERSTGESIVGTALEHFGGVAVETHPTAEEESGVEVAQHQIGVREARLESGLHVEPVVEQLGLHVFPTRAHAQQFVDQELHGEGPVAAAAPDPPHEIAQSLPELDQAAGQQQAVVVVGLRAGDRHVDLERVPPLGVLPPLDLVLLRRHDVGGRAGIVERLARLGQLDLLETVVDQDRYLETV